MRERNYLIRFSRVGFAIVRVHPFEAESRIKLNREDNNLQRGRSSRRGWRAVEFRYNAVQFNYNGSLMFKVVYQSYTSERGPTT